MNDNGCRLYYSGGEVKWIHPLEAPSDAIDLTDLDDAEFERFVASITD